MAKRPLKSLLLLAHSVDASETDAALLARGRATAENRLGTEIKEKEADFDRLCIVVRPDGKRFVFIPAWGAVAWDWHRGKGGVSYTIHDGPKWLLPVFEADEAPVKSAT